MKRARATLAAVPDSRSPLPRSAFLLRVAARREERMRLRYELQDLRSGTVHRFDSLAALTRFLRRHDAGAPPMPPAPVAPATSGPSATSATSATSAAPPAPRRKRR